jgi:glycosyltransferase involved in cell wall biosynthesis
MSNKLISFIVPAYNCSKTIDALLQTIDFNFAKDMEILIIDDGSTDNLKEKLAPWLYQYPHCIRYHYKENGN